MHGTRDDGNGNNGDDDGSANTPNGDENGQQNTTTVQQVAKLAADDGDPADLFGESVAIAGDGSTVIIGAPGDEDPNGQGSGSAYVFSRNGGGWQQTEKLVADDGDSGDRFGKSVAMAGDGSAATIGADLDEGPNGENSDGLGAGSAYVFE